MGGKTRNVTQPVLQESCITSCKALLPVLRYIKRKIIDFVMLYDYICLFYSSQPFAVGRSVPLSAHSLSR